MNGAIGISVPTTYLAANAETVFVPITKVGTKPLKLTSDGSMHYSQCTNREMMAPGILDRTHNTQDRTPV